MPFGEIAWKLPTGLGRQGTYKVTTFNSSGTWYKNRMCSYVMIMIWSSGQGAGSGRCGSTTAAGGGGGGNSGSTIVYYGPASWFGSSETVTVGATSNGGNAVGTGAANGNPGNVSNASGIGSLTVTVSGTAPTGGTTTTAAAGGSQSVGLWQPIAMSFSTQSPVASGGAGGNVTGTNASSISYNTSIFFPSGGGGGSGADSGTARQAGNGGSISLGNSGAFIAAAAGGIETGTVAGGTGSAGSTDIVYTGGGGGGGGGGMKSTAPGAGGPGGIPGGGGGGGGGSLTGTLSGAGGTGAAGQVIIFEFFV